MIPSKIKFASLDVAGNLEVDNIDMINHVYDIPLTSLKVHDGMQANILAAAANDDHGLVDDVSGLLTVVGVAADGASQTQYSAFEFVLPATYKAGSAVTLRVRAMEGVGAATVDTSIDVNAYIVGDDDAISADLCTTEAQTGVTTSYGNKDFVINAEAAGENLAPGDVIRFRIATIANDTGGSVGTVATINSIKVIISA